MSWRVYNGFILNNITTLEEALVYFKGLIPEFEVLADDHWKQAALELAVDAYDNDCWLGLKTGKNYLSDAQSLMWDKERLSAREGTKSFTNTSITASLTSIKLSNKKRIVGIFFADNEKLSDHFRSLKEIGDFSYYDNSDEPEEIPKKEWNQRKRAWNNIFKDSSTASGVMFGFDIIAEKNGCRYPKITEDDVQRFISSFEKRAYVVSTNEIVKDKTFDKVSDYIKFLQSTDADNARTAVMPNIEAVLNKTPTLSDLIGDK